MSIEIIIPAYNCSKTLHRTLSSLDCQTDTDFAVHIIDDCSTEDLSPIIDLHPLLNIRVTRNETNLGCGMSRQVGIDNTSADYIAFVDSDDVLMPYTVETWKHMATKAPHVDLFHSYFYEQLLINNRPSLALHKEGYTWCHGKLYKVSFIRKWDIRNRPDVKFADDSFFNSMCTELGEYAEIPIPVYVWLNNSESITRSGKMRPKETALDFIYAMKKSVEFVRSKGISKIEHIPRTIGNIKKTVLFLNDDLVNKEYKELLAMIK